MERKTAWEIWDKKTKDAAFDFCAGYKEFLSKNKTERQCIIYFKELAEKLGYEDLQSKQKLCPGDKIFKINKHKQCIFANIGKKPLVDGARFIVSHIDAPRLDLKACPLYEDECICLLKTRYYGGIKKYQWFSLPLALFGVVVMKNGQKKHISIGNNPEEPVFVIADLLPHLSVDQNKKTIEEGFPGENLNIIAGSIPADKKDKEKIKKQILTILKSSYGIEEQDFTSAELQAVPAGHARDVGFDKSMILGYGQDDRICAYTSFMALSEVSKPEQTAVCILVDQEEIGSYGSTSAQSTFFPYFMEEVLEKIGFNSSDMKYLFENSMALSADVGCLLNPNYKEVNDLTNVARLGCGVIVERTTGGRGKSQSTEPTAEYLAYIRKIFDKNKVVWQTGELGKGDKGGGGTVATHFARFNINTLDCGTGLISMHAPFEISSKADIYSTYKAYSAFYKEN